MKPPKIDRQFAAGATIASAQFGISESDQAHVMGILRDTLYSDKVLAVVREYTSNAWDAHRSVGKGDVPIEVHLPEENDLELRIRDRGPGLSQADVYRVYTQYGASTKRDDDSQVGALGIGSKSAFAYADSFTVTSWHDGQKSVYIAALDPSDRGVMSLVHQEPCDPAETGVEVRVQVKEDDTNDFENRARRLLQHMEPRPVINTELPEVPSDRVALPSGSIDYTSNESYNVGQWTAVMGCVPYRIRLEELTLAPEHACLRKLSGTVKFDIGQVNISANREDLRYTEATKKALVARFETLVDDYVAHAIRELEGETLTAWEKRLRVLTLAKLDVPLPEAWEDLGKAWVKIADADLMPFSLVRNEASTNQVTVDDSLRFLIDDTGLALKGYHLGQYDYVVRPKRATLSLVEEEAAKKKSKAKKTPEPEKPDGAALRALLDETLAACGLTGAPIELLSTQSWCKPWEKPKKSNAHRAKHKASMFRLLDEHSYFRKPYSEHWEVISRVPEPADVFVVIEGFDGYSGFYNDYAMDSNLATELGLELPPVYGYKHTEKKPIDPAKLVGTEYRVWRQSWAKSLLTPERLKLIEAYWQQQVCPSLGKKQKQELVSGLGRRHPIVKHALGHDLATKKLGKLTKRGNWLGSLALAAGVTREESIAAKLQAEIEAKYPLLAYSSEGMAVLWDRWDTSEKRQAWRDYVKLVDNHLALTSNATAINIPTEEKRDAADSVHAN